MYILTTLLNVPVSEVGEVQKSKTENLEQVAILVHRPRRLRHPRLLLFSFVTLLLLSVLLFLQLLVQAPR